MNVSDFVNLLIKEDLIFFTGVPCSYLKDFLAYINSRLVPIQHIIVTSEGEAAGLATGYHLATNKIPIIYLQNSGFGNIINPLTSLMDKEVYSIPTILFLTWRGKPNLKDEPQHKKMGRIMLSLLDDLEIPYGLASKKIEKTILTLRKLKAIAIEERKPVALIFQSDLIEKLDFKIKRDTFNSSLMRREQILEILLPKIGNNLLIATTGKTSREIFELRRKFNQSHKTDFLTVGSMGCASGIGLGIALQNKKNVFVVDGDGAVLMKMGTLVTIGYYKPKNFIHIIIDNNAYESTGGQPTTSKKLNWRQLLKGVGYKDIIVIKTKQELKKLTFEDFNSPFGVVIYSQEGSRSDLRRPTSSPIENKYEFMKYLST